MTIGTNFNSNLKISNTLKRRFLDERVFFFILQLDFEGLDMKISIFLGCQKFGRPSCYDFKFVSSVKNWSEVNGPRRWLMQEGFKAWVFKRFGTGKIF